MQSSRRIWMVLLVGGAALVSVAPASAAGVPSKVALAKAGVRVAWPVKTASASVDPSAKLVVKVHYAKAGKKPSEAVKLSFVDLGPGTKGKPLRASLRRGVFALGKLVAGHKYRLSMRAGGRLYTSQLSAVVGAAGSGGSAPGTPGTGGAPGSVDPSAACRGTAPETLAGAVSAPTVAALGSVTFSVVNTGPGCLTGGVCPRWERPVEGGGWAAVSTTSVCQAVAVIVQRGASYTQATTVPEAAVPGHYRVVWDYTSWDATGFGKATAELDVVAAG